MAVTAIDFLIQTTVHDEYGACDLGNAVNVGVNIETGEGSVKMRATERQHELDTH